VPTTQGHTNVLNIGTKYLEVKLLLNGRSTPLINNEDCNHLGLVIWGKWIIPHIYGEYVGSYVESTAIKKRHTQQLILLCIVRLSIMWSSEFHFMDLYPASVGVVFIELGKQ
jgi:hypothetical protein